MHLAALYKIDSAVAASGRLLCPFGWVGQTFGKPVEIEIVGLRAGEKVHEELFGEGESDTRPQHPLISHVPVLAVDLGLLVPNPTDARETMLQIIAN